MIDALIPPVHAETLIQRFYSEAVQGQDEHKHVGVIKERELRAAVVRAAPPSTLDGRVWYAPAQVVAAEGAQYFLMVLAGIVIAEYRHGNFVVGEDWRHRTEDIIALSPIITVEAQRVLDSINKYSLSSVG